MARSRPASSSQRRRAPPQGGGGGALSSTAAAMVPAMRKQVTTRRRAAATVAAAAAAAAAIATSTTSTTKLTSTKKSVGRRGTKRGPIPAPVCPDGKGTKGAVPLIPSLDQQKGQRAHALPSHPTDVLQGHEGAVLCVAFNASGAYALTGGMDRTIRLWNPARNLLVKSYTGGHAAASSDDGVRCLAASSDSARLASGGGSGDRGVAWWDVATGAVIRKWRGHDAAVGGVCLFDGGSSGSSGNKGNADDDSSKSTSLVVSASDDATARAWDPRSRSPNPVQIFRGAKDSLTGVGIAVLPSTTARSTAAASSSSSSSSSSHPLVVTASVDGRVRSYDPRKGELAVDDVGAPLAAMALGSTNSGNCAAMKSSNRNNRNNNDCALLAGLDGRLRLLDLRSGARLAEFSGHDASSGVRTGCALFGFSATSDDSSFPSSSSSSSSSALYAACGSEDGRVCCWAVENEGEMASAVSIHGPVFSPSSVSSSSSSSSGPVTALAIRPGDAGMLLAAGTDGRVRVFQRKQR